LEHLAIGGSSRSSKVAVIVVIVGGGGGGGGGGRIVVRGSRMSTYGSGHHSFLSTFLPASSLHDDDG